jgi:DNA-binding MarR family transcriptional regulator
MHSPVPASLEACFQLLRAQALLVRRFEVEFGDAHGLGLPDLQLLVELDRAPDGRLRRSELAERMALTAAGVTRMLGPLERIGLVAREPNPPDPRAAWTALTPAGRERVAEALVTATEFAEGVFDDPEHARELAGLGAELLRLADGRGVDATAGVEAE